MASLYQYYRLRKSVRDEFNQPAHSPTDSSGSQDKSEETKTVVRFEPCDPHAPRSWPTSHKILYTTLIFNLTLVAGWASAADSSAHETAASYFHVSTLSESLATSLYLLGVAIGALLAGPLSETIGRNATYLVTFAIYLCWLLGSALAPNFGAQIVFRFLAGLFASPSMSIFGGSLSDMFVEDERALVWPFFAVAPIMGPVLAPIAGGWLMDCEIWQWVDWLTLIISGAAFIAAVLFLPETFEPILLSLKAGMMRKETGNPKYTSELDESAHLFTRLKNNLKRIVYFTFREPTTLLFGLYITFTYILIYSFLNGFDFIFTQTYGFAVWYRYSCFGAVAIGILIGVPYVLTVNQISSRHSKVEGPNPEARLASSILAAPLLAISLFWIGWTNRPDISYWSNLGGCCLFGFSLYVLYASMYHYILDSYGPNAASAMGALTFMRYLALVGMVIATEPMYKALTVKYTLTLLGGVAALLTPVPWIFWWKGPTIRAKSKWAEK